MCAWPHCKDEGTFPAPRNPRNLSDRQYFCQLHIKEFNKKWNGLEGFSMNELYSFQDGSAQWSRPTWRMGLQGQPGSPPNPATAPKAKPKDPFPNADDLYGFFTSRLARERSGESLPSTRHLPADVKEACAIFSLEAPLPEPQLKKRYLTLVKQHHPDVNKSPDAPEYIKRINVAYRILLDYAARQPTP
jgi:DnaJ domain